MRVKIFCLSFLLIAAFAVAEGHTTFPQSRFARRIALPGNPVAITATDDGGNLLVFRGVDRILLRKVDATGKEVWQRDLQLSQLKSNETFHGGGVAQLSDNGYVLTAARIRADAGTIPFPIHSDAFVTKLTSTGSVEWQRRFGGSGSSANLDSVVASVNGGFVAAGIPETIADVPIGFPIASFDSSGEIQWAKFFGGDFYFSTPTLLRTRAGGLIVACQIMSRTGQDLGTLVFKVDPTGKLLWKKLINATGFDSLNFTSAAVTTDGGCILLLDQTGSLPFFHNCGLVRLSSAGELTVPIDRPYGGFFAKLNSAGKIVSSTQFAQAERLGFIVPISDSGYIAFGSSSTSGGGSLLLRLNSNARMPGCSRFISYTTESFELGTLDVSSPAITIKDWTPQQGTPDIRSLPLASKNDSNLCPSGEVAK